MKRNKHHFNVWILILSTATCIILIIGWALALSDILHTPTRQSIIHSPTVQPNKTQKNLLLGLGDSLTRGEGDEKGQGYFGIVKKNLEKEKMPSFSASNMAISGQKSSELIGQIQRKNIQKIISEARWITLTIGGNDLKESIGTNDKIDVKQADQARKQYITNLKLVLNTIKKLNPDVKLFIFSLYNPYGDLNDQIQSNELIHQWNEAIRQTTVSFPFVVMVPTFDLFQLAPKKYLYTDHFHPNHAGYQRMATRLMQVLSDTTLHKELSA
ncbi:Lysophospholipase L1 [Seinonella peptonophila]|uniref:Lysophospholipase L1 n=1 Tax=Seinonella peptonophila TaxID=112248 RepID=A0A1M4TSN8_9BACL|nr:GDSL-type esterase/lipase family protein [Seinonella peptonophila]SHE47327.1 Lysophospholipase L1 [Seinonella peptonophila]